MGNSSLWSNDEVKEEVKRFLNGLVVEFYDIGILKLEQSTKMSIKYDHYVDK